MIRRRTKGANNNTITTLTRFDPNGRTTHDTRYGAEAQAVLSLLGIASGRVTLRAAPVSSTPLLTYVRELQALQERFDIVCTDHQRWPLRRERGTGRHLHPEASELHAHDALELRVIVAGRLRYRIEPASPLGWWHIDCQPGDWIALPARLPHALLSLDDAPADVLRLFTHRGGGRPLPVTPRQSPVRTREHAHVAVEALA